MLFGLLAQQLASMGSFGVLAYAVAQRTQNIGAVLRYEDLILDARASVTRAVAALLPELMAKADAIIPSFDELHRVDETCFRRGAADSFRDEMSDELHELFWAQPENAAAMQRLGYAK